MKSSLDAISEAIKISSNRTRVANEKWNQENPPIKEIQIGESTIGIWKQEDSFGFAEKMSNGYNPSMIHWIDKIIIEAMQ